MAQPSQNPPNRLAKEKSAYLRQHAHNPVQWYPWGPDALERARKEDKPILLSVGYSACHWCHVMAHESFEDPATAALMNTHFINIKVDREERPDVDQLYQGVVQLLGRGGGWPLTVFLTPDLKPFFGGTYFPPEERHGLMAFPRLLQALAEAFKQRRADVDKQATEFVGGLEQLAAFGLDAAPNDLGPDQVVAAARLTARELDRTHGGFGGAPKFPNPMSLALLLRADRRVGDPDLRAGVMLTLEKMAKGGIYDQLGGGFHRYATDPAWLVPHFEKMLYDNAQLLHLYSEAQQVEPRPLWKRVVEETVEYVRREMTAPAGGFYASQDADSEGEEGKFFVWRPAELDAALTKEEADAFKARFNVTAAGNFEHGATILELKDTAPSELVESARKKLFAVREKRVKPGRDEKILAGWNGLMIRGLAFAARVFNRPDWADLAARSADFVLGQLWDGKRLLRLYQDGPSQVEGFAEDYGALAAGLTALYQATFAPRFLDAAEAITRRAVELLWDEERQAFLSAPRGQKDLVTTPYAVHDGASPSGASSLVEAQLALAAITSQPELMRTGAKYLQKLSDPMQRNPFAFGHLWLMADTYSDGAAELLLVGDSAELKPLLDAIRPVYAPTVALAVHDGSRQAPKSLEVTLQGRGPVGGKAAAYLCRKFSCDAPTTDAAQVVKQLRAVK